MKSDLRRILPWLGIPLVVAALAFLEPQMLFGGGLEGDSAPAFERPLVAGEGTGDVVSLANERGRVVVLDFWASWCGPCRTSIPILNRVRTRVGDKAVFYGVNIERTDALPPRALVLAHANFGAEFPSVRDHDGSLQRAYEVTRYPTIVIIDGNGVVRTSFSGVPSPDQLLRSIQEASRN